MGRTWGIHWEDGFSKCCRVRNHFQLKDGAEDGLVDNIKASCLIVIMCILVLIILVLFFIVIILSLSSYISLYIIIQLYITIYIITYYYL